MINRGTSGLLSAVVAVGAVAAVLSSTTTSVVGRPTTSARAFALSPSIRIEDFHHFPRFAMKLVKHSDAQSAFVWEHLTGRTRDELSHAVPPLHAKFDLAVDLNTLMFTYNLHDVEPFLKTAHRKATLRMLRGDPRRVGSLAINRALLEDAFPGNLVVSFVGKIFQDAANESQSQAEDPQQADAQQSEADNSAENAQAQVNADQAQDKADQVVASLVLPTAGSWDWGGFAGAVVGGAAGGAAGGAVAGSFAGGIGAGPGALAGGVAGAVGGAVGYAVSKLFGGTRRGSFQEFPATAAD